MHAIVFRRYGPASVLQLVRRPTPTPAPHEALVRVRAAAVNPGDWHLMRGKPLVVRFMAGGLLRPRLKGLGADIAGTVERVGGDVKGLRPGDDVFGHLAGVGFGGFAEYVSVPARALAAKPRGSSYAEAAAVPGAGLAALQGLRDHGRIHAGKRVLVNGASGGVGTFAVQIAKFYGAHVTGVCSAQNVDLVASLGADDVVDYTRQDVTRADRRYDLILDAAAFRPPWRYRRVLRPDGRYVMVGGTAASAYLLMLLGKPLSRLARRSLSLLMTAPNADDLRTLQRLVEAGRLAPVIDRRYALPDVRAAIRYVETGRARGKVVIDI